MLRTFIVPTEGLITPTPSKQFADRKIEGETALYQHVHFEDLAKVEDWAKQCHEISKTLLFDGLELPRMTSSTGLWSLAGPMNIYEEDKYPWLSKKKRFMRDAIASNKMVFGICLAVS